MGVASSHPQAAAMQAAMHAQAQAQIHPVAGHQGATVAAAHMVLPTVPHQSLHTPPGTMETYPDTDRRSSSIAALRLKAREHSAAMGILSVYGK